MHNRNPKKSSTKKKILFIGMVNSPHFQKWIHGVCDSETAKRIYIFPSDRFSSVPDIYKELNKSVPIKIIRAPLPSIVNYYLSFILDTFLEKKWRSYVLLNAIRLFRPHLLHFHEIQHGAYLFNPIRERVEKKQILKIVSTWGSDLTLYSKIGQALSTKGVTNQNHVMEIVKVLDWADVITAERSIESTDLNRLGFKGEFIAPVYITVGMSEDTGRVQWLEPSERKQIMIKGYQHDAGRALNAIEALRRIERQLVDYELVFYSTSDQVRIQAELLAFETNLVVRILPRVSQSQLLKEFQNSRIYIGLSTTDGLSTSMVEAMGSGCFPIQSENSAASLFITEGVSGFIVNPWEIEELSGAITMALNNNHLVDSAVGINIQTLLEKYNYGVGLQLIRDLYSR
jgi:glycosyltransferase involved in cell wall biosynthesis